MIKRYSDPRIEELWSLVSKYGLWQKTELAVIKARENLGRVPVGTHAIIEAPLVANSINAAVIKEKEAILQHDLNAFLEERQRFLSGEQQAEFHKDMTSYDTEEPAMSHMLKESCEVVLVDTEALFEELKRLALAYRYTPMNARTHGQEAEMQSFGKRCLTWHQDLGIPVSRLHEEMHELRHSKLSGAIGTNSGIDPELEQEALAILGLWPWAGATQIMPRALYAPIASTLADIAVVIDKIATDIRLGARSGRPIYHEPFGKKQKGSSAMPHKKNTINDENIEGMARMARHFAAGIKENIKTWEERSIEQSSVERVFWPDLFHVVLEAIRKLTKVLSGLVVYPDVMMTEIIESRGCYASSVAKELLVELGKPFGLNREEVYRIVQLASFNVFKPTTLAEAIRANPPDSLEKADSILISVKTTGGCALRLLGSIETVILNAELRPDDGLEAGPTMIKEWNEALLKIFSSSPEASERWHALFVPSKILANEAHLFKEVFGA